MERSSSFVKRSIRMPDSADLSQIKVHALHALHSQECQRLRYVSYKQLQAESPFGSMLSQIGSASLRKPQHTGFF